MDDHRIAILICCVLVISYNIYNSSLLLLDIILHTDLVFKKISEKNTAPVQRPMRCILPHTSRQLPPINSRKIEFFGISSLLTPIK